MQEMFLNVWKGLNIFCYRGCRIYSYSTLKRYEWCQSHRDFRQTPVGDLHCCWSQAVSSGTGESRESDVNTGGGLWNCRLSRKNKRPAVGAHRWAGGNRQLEGSPIYGAAKCWAADSTQTPDCPSPLVWPFDPNTVPPPSSITVFSTCIKVIIKSLCKCLLSIFLFFSRHKGFHHHNTAALCHGVRAVYSRRGFCDLLLDTTGWFFFFFFFGPQAVEIAWSQSSKRTAQPSGLWISLNTGHSSLSCMWIFSLVQFQIN